MKRDQEKDKKNKKTEKHNFCRAAVALLAGIALLTAGLFSDMTRLKDVRAAGAPIRTIKYIKWTKLYEMPQNGFFGMLMFEWNGSYYFSSGNKWGAESDHGLSWTAVNINVDPYISTGDTFYTKGLMDVPYFHYGGTDGDNKNARKYILEFYSGGKATGKYLDRQGGSHIQSNSWSSADWMTIMDKKRADEKGIGKYVTNGVNIIFWNKSGNDTVLRKSIDTNGNGCFCGCSSGGDDDWDGNSRFWVYAASEVEYSCIYGDWTMDNDQVYVAEDDLILMDGATLTIPEGSVLCVKGSFLVNGTIKCHGTILVEDGGVMMPFTPKKKGGDIDIDGGTLAIMSGGRVYAGNPKGYLNATENAWFYVRNSGTVVNYGILAAGIADVGTNSVVENHGSGTILFGMSLSTPGKFLDTVTLTDSNIGVGSRKLGLINSGALIMRDSATYISYPGAGFLAGGNSDRVYWQKVIYDDSGNVQIKAAIVGGK